MERRSYRGFSGYRASRIDWHDCLTTRPPMSSSIGSHWRTIEPPLEGRGHVICCRFFLPAVESRRENATVALAWALCAGRHPIGDNWRRLAACRSLLVHDDSIGEGQSCLPRLAWQGRPPGRECNAGQAQVIHFWHLGSPVLVDEKGKKTTVCNHLE